MPLRSPRSALRHERRSERVSAGWLRVVRVGKQQRSRNSVVMDRSFTFHRAALLAFDHKIDGIALESSLQWVSLKVTSELVSILLQLQRKVHRCPVKDRADRPSSGDNRVGGT